MSLRSAPQSQAEICPDPTAHSKDKKLQDSASKAALYATSPSRNTTNPLGADGKLSAASAATSLKYAKPHELPSFPSVGIDAGSSGNQAANLSYSNQKPFEHWKPELSSSAGKAALLAHRDGGKLDLWQPTSSETGLTAAGAAMGIKSSPQLDYGYTEDGRKRALMAATLSVSGRAKSPEKPASKLYPDQHNAAHNALNAATVAHRPSTRTTDYGPMSDPANEASRLVHGMDFNKAMYGEHPPVDIEVQEQKHQAALRASSISIAKQMQEVQARKSEDAYYAGLVAEDKSHAMRTGSKNTPDNIRAQALGYLNLQEAAQRLAAERLKKLDPDGILAYQEHWGMGPFAEDQQEKPQRKKTLSVIRRRGRESVDDDSSDSDADAAEAAKIRGQMRGINSELENIDAAKKRDQDRSNLLALAQKSVKARMSAMDDKVFRETGKASPSLMAEWEEKARAKAAANNEERMKNYGKIHIGGGQYMDQSELEAIAQRRMQPTLDEIADTAEKQRARDAEIAMDLQQRKEQAEIEKQREREVKAAMKRTRDEEAAQNKAEKNQEKARQAEIKREQKEREKDEKEYQKMQKRMEKDQEKQKKEEQKAFMKEKEAAEKERKQKAKASEDSAEKAAATGAVAGAVAGGEGATATEPTPTAEPVSELGETTVESKATRAAHDDSTDDPPGVPTTFTEEDEEPETAEPTDHTKTTEVSKDVATKEEDDDAAPSSVVAPVSTSPTSTTEKPAKVSSEKERGSKRRSFLSRFKRAINDPAQQHTPEGQAPTEHTMQAVDFPEKEESKVDKGKGKEVRDRSPSPDFEEEEQKRVRPTAVSKESAVGSVEGADVWSEAQDKFDEPTAKESKFHEAV